MMSSLSYRKRPNLDSIGGKGDALFSALKENAKSEDVLSFQKAKPKSSDFKDDTFSISSRRKSHTGDDLNDTESVVSQAYSEANSRARKGMDSRWADFDKESTISFAAPSRASTRLGLSPENDVKSTISLGLSSPLGRRQRTSRLDEGRVGRSLYGSSPSSPCFSRRSGGRSPGSISQADSHMSLARSCRLSEFDVDIDDSRSVAFTERSAYSPHSSTGRSVSMPPPQARSSIADNDEDIKTVSHRNYLDPDLEKAINEVLNFKPIKFKRRSLDDSEGEVEKSKNDDDDKGIRNHDSTRPASSLRRSASALDCLRPSRSSSSCSSRHRSKSKGKSKKKKRSHSSESNSSGDDRRHRSSSKRRSKKSKKKSRKRDESSSSSSSSSDSESESGSESSSGASTISYRSSSSVKRAPAKKVTSLEGEEEARPQSESQPVNKKEDKKRKKKVDSLMMKYLYRPDSD